MTVTRTIRLEAELDEALEKLASDGGESVNALLNRTLRKLAEWDRVAEAFGIMGVAQGTLIRLMEAITQDQARELGVWAAREQWEPMMRYMYGQVSVDSVLRSIDLLARNSSRFIFDHVVMGRKHVITIRHSMGMKWSSFYEGAARTTIEDLLGLKCVTQLTGETVDVEFQTQDKKEGAHLGELN